MLGRRRLSFAKLAGFFVVFLIVGVAALLYRSVLWRIIDKLALTLLALSVRPLDLSSDLFVGLELTMPILLAQCIMCFRSASAQQLERARVLNEAILVLGIPPLCILAAFAYLAFRRR